MRAGEMNGNSGGCQFSRPRMFYRSRPEGNCAALQRDRGAASTRAEHMIRTRWRPQRYETTVYESPTGATNARPRAANQCRPRAPRSVVASLAYAAPKAIRGVLGRSARMTIGTRGNPISLSDNIGQRTSLPPGRPLHYAQRVRDAITVATACCPGSACNTSNQPHGAQHIVVNPSFGRPAFQAPADDTQLKPTRHARRPRPANGALSGSVNDWSGQ